MTGGELPLVAHVIYALTTGGLENGLVNLINRSPPGRYRHAIICITSADDFAQRITAPDVQIHQLHKRDGHDLGFYWRLRKLLYQLRPAIIHTRNLAALETQVCALGLSGVKRVHGEHGREITDVDGTNRKYRLLRQSLRPLVDRYIAVSKDLEQWLVSQIKVPPGKISQIYNGVDTHRFHPGAGEHLVSLPVEWGNPASFTVIGTVGRLSPVKNQQLILDAVVRLKEQYPDLAESVRILLVGDGPEREALQAKAKALALDAILWMPGDCTEIPELLASMDIFVLPSLGEGISNTILEAMAAGLPVVATAVGGNPELVEEGVSGSLVPSQDPAAMAAALARLLASEDERRTRGQNARQRICQQFNWDNTVRDYLDIYDQLLDVPARKRVGSAG